MRIMITGGGTGGHISPALAIIEELRRRDAQLLLQWIGRRGGMEERASRRAEVPFRALAVEGWPRKTSPRRVWAALKYAVAAVRAYLYLKSFQPQVVIGVGGYVSLPVMYVAQRLGIPTMLHEQNKRLGMANRALAARAECIFLSYPETIGSFPPERARVVGNPVRAGFITPPPREEARARFGLEAERPVVLIVGGSQGAASLNRAVSGMLPEVAADELQMIWMTGKSDYANAAALTQRIKARVEVLAYIEDMVSACAAADLVVARAGASSTAELAVMGKPSILVPYPHATDNHQEQNARAFEEAGGAVLLLDRDCTPERLLAIVRGLLADPVALQNMAQAAHTLGQPLAAETIAEEVMFYLFG
ncbi:MAG: undecaprenyldiphospho-muramoylpentapeptide beta-N-acetylglucosaminyltransferase [Candidatus Hydrogenedentes bacterium]|nr:undecaprenyldiphospho-muramoylpentapeptide beta-N-acetylglucosaminyltransferase [Candidatus Hydrogenedentota bacterium]